MARKLLQTAEAKRRRARYRAKKGRGAGLGSMWKKMKNLGSQGVKYALDNPGQVFKHASSAAAKYRSMRGSGLSKSVITAAKAAGKKGSTSLPPTATKAIQAKIRAATEKGSGLGAVRPGIRTAQTKFKGNPWAQRLSRAGLGKAASQLHSGMQRK